MTTAISSDPISSDPINYTVDLSDRLHHLVRVSLMVPDDLASGARLVLAVWTPGSYVVRNYVHHVQWITATDVHEDPVPLELDGVSAWRLPSGVDGPVTVRLSAVAQLRPVSGC